MNEPPGLLGDRIVRPRAGAALESDGGGKARSRGAAAVALAAAIAGWSGPAAAGPSTASVSPAPADSATVAQIDSAVAKIVSAGHLPSVVAAVSRDGAVAYAQAFGFANLARRVPATVQTHYEIGSITKQFTAAAILQLKEAGKLSLDDPLARWIPEYRRGAKVTIRELLQQTTGIYNYTEVDGFVKIATTQAPSFARILALVANKPLAFAPGSKFAYSNTNYILLGEIVERASGTPWERYVRAHEFAPAAMTHSGFIDDEPRLQPMATGYVQSKKGLEVAPPL
ncbi:MAG TPA: serine hydrolase domain-containing protein, partial [Candidatus Acidoferrales bacterium]|nr:serine hydrolase domain-containing protein [Candidatus Acidoferrales bacterium]